MIKLVIWDLDDTFWNGTLSEEGVSYIEKNINLVKELTKKGIINSISSKNDLEKVEEELRKIGILEYFVFPKVGWYQKSNAIKDTLSQMSLRAENTLFIDDNHLNLIEVEKAIPGITVIHPEKLYSYIIDSKRFLGKEDKDLTRLKQYKILEEKYNIKQDYDSDFEFLTSCNIKVECRDAISLDSERIYDLITRANQLNFTKIRLKLEEVDKIILDNKFLTKIIKVRDNYGDYGLVGFIAINIKDKKIEHFCFSCRVMNLGIEQWVYNKFEKYDINIIGDTAVTLIKGNCPSWINQKIEDKTLSHSQHTNKILFKGGCDLLQTMYYLKASNDIVEETNKVSSENLPIHAEHSLIINKKVNLNFNFPYLKKEHCETDFFNNAYTYVIYSALMDFTQDIYTYKEQQIPFGGYGERKDLSKLSINNRDIMSEFYSKFINTGQITPNDFLKNMRSIINKLSINTKLIILNGSEVSPKKEDYCAIERHVTMNKCIDKLVSEYNGKVILIDVRQIVKNENDLTDNIRHYKRKIYKKIADCIISELDNKIEIKKVSSLSIIKKSVINKLRLLKNAI